jgi:hypothetical protein
MNNQHEKNTMIMENMNHHDQGKHGHEQHEAHEQKT